MELGKTAYVVLGMLSLGKRTGYDIKSLVDVSTRFFWAASYGQIYPELKRLEDLRLVKSREVPQGGRRRVEYALTAAGRKALREWLLSDADPVMELRHAGLLRFFLADALPVEQRVELLRNLRADHERGVEAMRQIEPGARAGAEKHGHDHPLLTLEWGIAYQDFVINWCSETERRIIEQTASGQRS